MASSEEPTEQVIYAHTDIPIYIYINELASCMGKNSQLNMCMHMSGQFHHLIIGLKRISILNVNEQIIF